MENLSSPQLTLTRTLDLIESVRDYKVLFVGHTIVDEYHYVSSLGKSPKEHLISVQFDRKEVFDGGVIAAAKHARSFCNIVDVFPVGEEVRKVRYVDPLYTRKLFEVHFKGHGWSSKPFPADYDILVVTDFGHGAMPEVYPGGKFFAVNAQTNSANIGYNLITKYESADYIVIDESEARLAAADRESSIEEVILKLAKDRCDRFVVTHGAMGAIGYDHGTFYRCPAFTDRVVDTMGAGDAFFAITAPMAKHGRMDDLLRIGNAAGALKTQIVGHQKPVTKEALIEFLRTH
jgi:bifunctional ADP-heptose synthase (sugar kinase/adenylyltransferase)